MYLYRRGMIPTYGALCTLGKPVFDAAHTDACAGWDKVSARALRLAQDVRKGMEYMGTQVIEIDSDSD